MSDSLRDQLMQAGFNAPQEPVRKKRNHSGNSSQNASSTRGQPAGNRQGNTSKRQSLRDTPPKNSRTTSQSPADADSARRKAIKTEIKTLIETAAIKEFQGDSVYRFILNKRIRELHVKEDIRQQLVAGTLIITRLNGKTWLVPDETSAAIRALNPDWAVVTPASDEPEDTAGYEDFAVPDDLQW